MSTKTAERPDKPEKTERAEKPDKAERPQREDWSFEELQAEADEIRTRLNRFRTSLGRFFVNKQELIDLMLVAAVAQEPLLLRPARHRQVRPGAQVQGRAWPR